MSVLWVKRLQTFFHPERFQGWGRKRSYFEGWYYKLIDRSATHCLALIPGIAWDQEGNGHAFIQVLDGSGKKARYHRFSPEHFRPAASQFAVSIFENSFSDKRVKLDVEGCKGEVRFSNGVSWPKPFYSPGIMGPFAFVPFMECYHGIVSMYNDLEGQLTLENHPTIDFTGGRGYIEKDWGRSFPSAYMWMQCNHFSQPGISLKCSVARIPWLGSSFTGFIAGLWWNNRLYRFTTYNRSRLLRSTANWEKVELVLENPAYQIRISILRDAPTALASPILGLMEGRIEETMNGKTTFTLIEKRSGKIVLEETGTSTALEVAGTIEEIMIP